MTMMMVMMMKVRVMTVKENGLMQKIRLSHFVTQTVEMTAVSADLRVMTAVPFTSVLSSK